jgi:RNA polymerase sigma factor (sigma-70 family)
MMMECRGVNGFAHTQLAYAIRYPNAQDTARGVAGVRPMDDWQSIQVLVEQVQDCQQQAAQGLDGATERLERVRDRLFEQLRPQLHAMIRRMVRDTDLAQDILQEVLILVVRKLGNYDRYRAPFRQWVARVAIHEVYRQLRSQSQCLEVSEAELFDPEGEDDETLSPLESAPDPAPTPGTVAAYRERLNLILECARASLDEEAYTIWYEYLCNGTPHEQLALLMNRREDWVRQTLHRARLKVAAAIVQHPAILSDEEINAAIDRCLRSRDPLSQEEIAVLRQSLATHSRQPPGWRQINLFRQACLKVLSWVEI